ncbi:hypothetical protein OH76DRAFT_271406 [Lentinus brumalis]|uniref:Uncharacterized protein n=1 Tax=Lentinus brumalis TaxID=2498619 RepID=A0A371DGU7_9APHY|nr:hypothetical protein OH76DRAFT_271406 [Polyporus brumalis]
MLSILIDYSRARHLVRDLSPIPLYRNMVNGSQNRSQISERPAHPDLGSTACRCVEAERIPGSSTYPWNMSCIHKLVEAPRVRMCVCMYVCRGGTRTGDGGKRELYRYSTANNNIHPSIQGPSGTAVCAECSVQYMIQVQQQTRHRQKKGDDDEDGRRRGGPAGAHE